MVDVRSDYSKFQAAGGEVLVVTMGSVSQVAAFRRRLDLPFPCLADADRKAYQAYEVGLGSLNQIAGPSVWGPGLKALVRGGLGIPQGDTRQMQGAFVIDRAGIIRYRHEPTNSAENPSNAELLQALKSCQQDSADRSR